jgi:hypothetical protein
MDELSSLMAEGNDVRAPVDFDKMEAKWPQKNAKGARAGPRNFYGFFADFCGKHSGFQWCLGKSVRGKRSQERNSLTADVANFADGRQRLACCLYAASMAFLQNKFGKICFATPRFEGEDLTRRRGDAEKGEGISRGRRSPE